jgi:hypothetical protein
VNSTDKRRDIVMEEGKGDKSVDKAWYEFL